MNEEDRKSLAGVDPKYFNSSPENFDSVKSLLENSPETLSSEFFSSTEKKLVKQQGTVDEVLSSKILGNYNSFVVGMRKINELGEDLRGTMRICRKGKNMLSVTKDLVRNGLEIIWLKKKLENLENVDKELRKLKKYKKIERGLEKYLRLKPPDFESSINLLGKLHQSISEIKELKCSKLSYLYNKDKLYKKKIERSIEGEVRKNLKLFNPLSYNIVHTGIKLMKVEEYVYSQLFISYYKAKIDNIVNNVEKQNLMKRSRSFSLAKYCFTVIDQLTMVLYNYQLIFLWHKKNSKIKKVNTLKKEIWGEIRSNLTYFFGVVGEEWNKMKIDNFFRVYNSFNLFFDICYEFCNGSIESNSLKNTLNNISKRFFTHFHRKTVFNEILLILENEMWIQLDYKFSLRKLYTNLGYSAKFRKVMNKIKPFFSSSRSLGIDEKNRVSSRGVSKESAELTSLRKILNGGKFFNIFSKQQLMNPKETKKSSDGIEILDDEDYDDELDDEFDDGKEPKIVVNVAKTIINKLIFYLNAMEILKPISRSIFQAFTTLINFYIYAIYALFKNNYYQEKKEEKEKKGRSKKWNSNVVDEKGRRIIFEVVIPENDEKLNSILLNFFKKVRKDLNQVNKDSNILFPFPMPQVGKQNQPFLSVKERYFAIESFNIIYRVLVKLKPKLEHLLPEFKSSRKNDGKINIFLEESKFYLQVKKMLYETTVPFFLEMKDYDTLIAGQNYSIKNDDNFNQANPVFLGILQDFKGFKKKILKFKKGFQVQLWTFCIDLCVKKVLNGYSKVKKCNIKGRGKMMMDFENLKNNLEQAVVGEKISWPASVGILRSYLNAFYMNGFEEIVSWTKKNQSIYTKDQMKSLVLLKASKNVGKESRLSSKNKNKILKMIQEL